MESKISIKLSARDRSVIYMSLSEYGGGSASAMRRISGHAAQTISEVDRLYQDFWDSEQSVLSLSESQWRVIYNSINATVCALGPFELETCTGCEPIDMLETNLTIASKVWGAYGGVRWSDYYKVVRV